MTPASWVKNAVFVRACGPFFICEISEVVKVLTEPDRLFSGLRPATTPWRVLSKPDRLVLGPTPCDHSVEGPP